MKDPNIKSVIQSQLDSIEMDKHLRYKTLEYIENKSSKVYHPKWKIIRGSLGAVAVCLIGFISIQLPEIVSRPESVSMLGEEGSINARQSTSPLQSIMNILDQLQLNYSVGLTESNDGYIITSIKIDEVDSYYIELSTVVDNHDFCLNNKQFTIIELDEKHLFFYAGENDEVVQLLTNTGTVICN